MAASPIDVAHIDVGTRKNSPVTLNRTCQDCKRRKIRCVVSSSERDDGARKCKRCLKLNLDCVFLPPVDRKGRRRNEARIRELERKFETIHAAVVEGRANVTLPSHPLLSLVEAIGSPLPVSDRSQSRVTATDISVTSPHSKSFDSASGDILARGLVNNELAQKLYAIFCNDLESFYPLVHMPAPSTWQAVRQDRPALFLAVLTAAASAVDPKLSEGLFEEAGRYVAERVVIAGEKSLDLVQALLILSTWYHPPQRFQDLKFSQYAHMAATMVMDLQSSNDKQHKIPSTAEPSVLSDSLMETCRTFLACYFLCSSMAVSLRRPNMLSYGPWVTDCVRILEAAPIIHLNDRRLIAWAKLQRFAEKSLAAIGLGQGSSVNLHDARTRFILKGCVDQVKMWRQTVPHEIINETMEIHYQMVLISLYEPALHNEHDLVDFRPPYTIRALSHPSTLSINSSLQVADVVARCAESAETLIRTFLDVTIETLRSIPVVTYTRLTYAVIVLIKSCISMRVLQSAAIRPYGPSVNMEEILFQILERLHAAAGQECFRVPAVFHQALSNVTKWWIEHFDEQHPSPRSENDDLIEPMMHISLEDSTDIAIDVVEENSREDHSATHEVNETLDLLGQCSASTASASWDDLVFLRDLPHDAPFAGETVPDLNFPWDMAFEPPYIAGLSE